VTQFKPDPPRILAMTADQFDRQLADTKRETAAPLVAELTILREYLLWCVDHIPVEANPKLVEITAYLSKMLAGKEHTR
jgi:hypothetical protein